jgi:hypothetical protein
MDIYGEPQMLTYLQTNKWDVGLDIRIEFFKKSKDTVEKDNTFLEFGQWACMNGTTFTIARKHCETCP